MTAHPGARTGSVTLDGGRTRLNGWILACCVTCICSCAASYELSREGVPMHTEPDKDQPKTPIEGITDDEGTFRWFHSYVRLFPPDSIEFIIPGKRVFERVTADAVLPEGFDPDTVIVVPRDRVRWVHVVERLERPFEVGLFYGMLGSLVQEFFENFGRRVRGRN